MLKPVNPFTALAFYEGNFDISLKGWVFSPVSKLPQFIIPIADDDDISAWSIVNVQTGVATSQNTALLELIETTDGVNFIYYDGANLSTPPTPTGGEFRVLVTTTAGRSFYSHRVAMTRFFDSATTPAASITDCAIAGEPGQPYSIEFTVTASAWGNVRLSIDETKTGSWLSIDTGTGAITMQSTILDTPYNPSFSAYLRVEWFYQDVNFPAGHYISRVYLLEYDGLDPCGTYSLTSQSTLTQYAPEALIFEWWNDNDLQPLSIYYAGGMKNQLYFKAALESPTAVVEEEYEENGEGDTFLTSATLQHQYNASFWPCPDFLVLSLASARQHSDKTVKTVGAVTTTLTQIAFSDSGIDGEHNRQGLLQMQTDKAFIGGCVDDYTLAP